MSKSGVRPRFKMSQVSKGMTSSSPRMRQDAGKAIPSPGSGAPSNQSQQARSMKMLLRTPAAASAGFPAETAAGSGVFYAYTVR